MSRTKIASLTLGLFALAALAQTPSAVTPGPISSPEIKLQHQKLYADQHIGKDIVKETQSGKDVNLGVATFILTASDPAIEKTLPAYPDHYLLALSCGADAIVVGQPMGAETSLTETKDFLFTDYRFHVATVVKSLPGLGPDSDIIVTHPGGKTVLNGHSVNVEAWPQFDLTRRYLLFLRYMPETKTYRAFKRGTFLLGADQFSPVKHIDPVTGAIQTKSAQHENEFVLEIRAASTSSCAGINGAELN